MSREAELYKDKIEVSLDGRQIFYLFFGGAVIVGLVFVLGVMVGRRVEARGHTDRARVAATVDPLAALDRLEGGSGLSFQGALRGAEGPVTDVEKAIADRASAGHPASGSTQPKVEKKADAPSADAKDEPKVEAKKEDAKADVKKDESKLDAKKGEQKADLEKDDVKAEAKKDDAKKTDAKAEAAKPEKKAETKSEVKTDTKTAAKAEPKKEDAKKDEGTKDEGKKGDGKKDDAKKEDGEKKKFTLQLSSFQDKAEAQAYLDSMKSAGYAAYLTEAAVDGKQYFRVRLGNYKSMDAASEAKTELEKNTKKSAIVIKL